MAPPNLSPEAEEGEDMLMKLAYLGEPPTRLEMRILKKIYWYSYDKPKLYRNSGVSFDLACPPGWLRLFGVKEGDAYEAFRALYWKGLTEKAIQEQLPFAEENERTVTFRFTLAGRDAVEKRDVPVKVVHPPSKPTLITAQPPTEKEA